MDEKIIYTPQFKKWFGDWEINPDGSSKVVDEQGYPMLVYHGTDAEFNAFSSKFMGQTGTACGQGFYFSSIKDDASAFGGNVKTFFLNIRKPLSDTELTISEKDFYKLLDEIDKAQILADSDFGYGILSDYGDVDYYGREKVLRDAVKMEISSSDNDVELIGGIVNATNDYDLVMNVLRNVLGYDGVIVKSKNIFVAHHPNQIKEYTNKKFNTNSNNMYESKHKTIYITESQFEKIKEYLKEDVFFVDSNKVLIVKKYLDKFFKRGSMENTSSDGYQVKTNIIGMMDSNGNVVKNMTFNQTLDLLEDKFHTIYSNKEKRTKFLRSVLKDWFYKKITKEGLLSINNF